MLNKISYLRYFIIVYILWVSLLTGQIDSIEFNLASGHPCMGHMVSISYGLLGEEAKRSALLFDVLVPFSISIDSFRHRIPSSRSPRSINFISCFLTMIRSQQLRRLSNP